MDAVAAAIVGVDAQLLLPGEEVGAVEVVAAVGIAVAAKAEVAFPLSEICCVDDAVAVDIGGGQERYFTCRVELGEVPIRQPA